MAIRTGPKTFVVHPYEEGDFERILHHVPTWGRLGEQLPQPNPAQAYSAWGADGLIACAGLDLMWPGVAQAWAMFMPSIPQYYPQSIVRSIRRHLAGLIEEHSLWRVEAHAHAGTPMACKLLEVLGFHREVLKRKYGPDKSDFWLYAWLREEDGSW